MCGLQEHQTHGFGHQIIPMENPDPIAMEVPRPVLREMDPREVEQVRPIPATSYMHHYGTKHVRQ